MSEYSGHSTKVIEEQRKWWWERWKEWWHGPSLPLPHPAPGISSDVIPSPPPPQKESVALPFQRGEIIPLKGIAFRVYKTDDRYVTLYAEMLTGKHAKRLTEKK